MKHPPSKRKRGPSGRQKLFKAANQSFARNGIRLRIAVWGKGSVIGHDGKKKGPTAWARKAIAENKKGKRIVLLYPIDKWVLMMLAAGAKVRNLGDVRWCATEDGTPGKGTGRHIAAFILEPPESHDR